MVRSQANVSGDILNFGKGHRLGGALFGCRLFYRLVSRVFSAVHKSVLTSPTGEKAASYSDDIFRS